MLLLGRPGVGKTTVIREIARLLSQEMNKRVVIVDTSNEIGGDGDVPHPAIGSARRMQVPDPSKQHHVMIEAVENHMPQVIIVVRSTGAGIACLRPLTWAGLLKEWQNASSIPVQLLNAIHLPNSLLSTLYLLSRMR